MGRTSSSTTKVCFVGGPGTGKSTLAQAVNVALKMRGVDTEQVPEYARTYIRRSGTPLHYLEQFPLVIGAMRQEEEVEVHDVMIVDSASFIMAVYMMYYYPQHLEEAERIKWEYHFGIMQGLARERLNWFDHIFYVPSGLFPAQNDVTRYNAPDSEDICGALKTYLDANGAPYYQVQEKGLEARVAEVITELERAGAIESTQATKSKPGERAKKKLRE